MGAGEAFAPPPKKSEKNSHKNHENLGILLIFRTYIIVNFYAYSFGQKCLAPSQSWLSSYAYAKTHTITPPSEYNNNGNLWSYVISVL